MTGIWLIMEQLWTLFLTAKIPAHLVPFSKGQMGNLSRLGVSLKKTVQFQGKLFTSSFLQAAVAGPILGIDFLRKFKVTVIPEINQIQFACIAAARPPLFFLQRFRPPPSLFSAASSASPCLFSSPQVPAPVPIQLPTATTSSQPPAISAQVVRNPEVKSFSFSSRKTSLCWTLPPLYKRYLILCLLILKLCKNSTLFCASGMWSLHQPMRSSITSTRVATPLFLQNPAASIWKNCNLPNRVQKFRFYWHNLSVGWDPGGGGGLAHQGIISRRFWRADNRIKSPVGAVSRGTYQELPSKLKISVILKL